MKVHLTVNGGQLTLSGANTYTGATTVSAGTLALGANNTLPDASAVSIGAGTLDAATFTDTLGTLGTLDATEAATINLGTGAALAFADSSAVNWVGALDITGDFVPGSSIRFGTTSGGLTPTQLGVITVNGGGGPFSLDANGFLIAGAPDGFAAWQAANSTTSGFSDDHDNDGVSNGVEYFLGGIANTTGFTALPGVVNTGGTLSVTWTKSASYTGTYGTHFVVETSATLAPDSWIPEASPGNVTISGNNVTYTFPAGARNFARLKVTSN
jgi:autotransporter-associated beta strand protein